MKRGFTLVELLATIVIIVALALLITPRLKKVTDENRNKAYKEIERRLEEASQKYVTEEYISSSLTSLTITKADLIDKKYIGEVYDLKDNSVCNATINVTNLDTNPTFKVHLTCRNYIS